MSETQAPQVQTVSRGAVPEDAMDLAVLRVRAELRAAREPVLFARIKLAVVPEAAAGRHAVAQTNVDLNGQRVRAQAVAETMRAAIELMCDRLTVQLDRAERRFAGDEVGEIGRRLPLPRWSAEVLPGQGHPAGTPSVVRHKSYGLARLTPDEAIADLELLDYDFHLFTERATDNDSVVYVSENGYQLAQADPRPDLLGLEALGGVVTVSEVPAPRLDVAQARARLEALDQPFMFFVNNQSGRGNLLYHRHDGGYGLITPADA